MNDKKILQSIIITGANGGLGMETIKWLIEDGYRDITLALLRKYNLIAPDARVIVAGGEGARGLSPFIDKPDFGLIVHYKFISFHSTM